MGLRAKSKKEKLFLIEQKVKLNSADKNRNDKSSSSKSKYKTVLDYVNFLANCTEPGAIGSKELAECIKSLKIELRGNTVSWVRDFGRHNGHIKLLSIIRLCSKSNKVGGSGFGGGGVGFGGAGLLGAEASVGGAGTSGTGDGGAHSYSTTTGTSSRKQSAVAALMADCVQCLSSFMNNSTGFSMVFQCDQAFVILVQSLDPRYPAVMSRTLELLAAVALVEAGVERILNAFTDAAAEAGRRERFWIIVEGLKLWKNGKDSSAVAVAAIQLVNALITNHDELEQRFHLRNELYRTTDEAGRVDFRSIATEVEGLPSLAEEREKEERANQAAAHEGRGASAEPTDGQQPSSSAENGQQLPLTTTTTTPAGRPLSTSGSNHNLAGTATSASWPPQHVVASQLPPERKFVKFFLPFFQSRDDDFDEFANRFESIRIDFDVIDDCYSLLRQTVKETPNEQYLLSILQMLLFIRDDPLVR